MSTSEMMTSAHALITQVQQLKAILLSKSECAHCETSPCTKYTQSHVSWF